MPPPPIISDPVESRSWKTSPQPGAPVVTAPLPDMPPPPVITPTPEIQVEAEAERSTPKTFAAFEQANSCINRIEVLSNRVVPGTDGAIEHVILANHQVTIVRSTPLKGRVRIARDNAYVGGVSCKVLLTGLQARVDTVRHLVGGDALVYGALFLSKQRQTPLKKLGTVTIGSPRTVIESIIEAHCATPPSPRLAPLAAELDGMFLPIAKLNGYQESRNSWEQGEWS